MNRVINNRVACAALAIVAFSLLDGALTLLAINNGEATEFNPIMSFWMSLGATPFMIVKMTITSLGVVMLAAASDKVTYISKVMYFSTATYIALIGYHFVGGVI